MNGCHKCPANDKCTVTYRGSSCAAIRYSYGLEDDPEIKTNADRIRAMTDEELEAFLINVDLDKEGSPFITDWGKWLQQPAEVK